MLRIRVPRRPRMEDEMPRESIRQWRRRLQKPRVEPQPKPKPKPKPKRPRTPPRGPRGPRKGECMICLKPSCMHLNMSRRLGAPLVR